MGDEEREGAGKRVRLVRRAKKKVRLVRRKDEGADPADLLGDEADLSDEGTLGGLDAQDGDPVDEQSLWRFLSEFGAEDEPPEGDERRRLSKVLAEAMVPGVVRKLIAREGLSEEFLGRLLAELPRGKPYVSPLDKEPEVAESADEGEPKRPRRAGLRGELQKVVAQELRAFLETVDLSGEVQKILGAMSLEVRTQIRFVPNDAKLKPEVKHKVQVRRSEPS